MYFFKAKESTFHCHLSDQLWVWSPFGLPVEWSSAFHFLAITWHNGIVDSNLCPSWTWSVTKLDLLGPVLGLLLFQTRLEWFPSSWKSCFKRTCSCSSDSFQGNQGHTFAAIQSHTRSVQRVGLKRTIVELPMNVPPPPIYLPWLECRWMALSQESTVFCTKPGS